MKYFSILALMASLVACKQDYEQNETNEVSIKSARVVLLKPTDAPLPIHVAGKIDGNENIKLSFKVGGIVRRLHFDEGQYVKKGQLMATLDLEEINSQVSQAEANVEKIKRDLSRFQRLLADSAATLQSVQDTETGLKIAESDLKIAIFNQRYSQIVAPASGLVLKKMTEANELVISGQEIYQLASDKEGMVLSVGLSDRDMVRIQLGDRAEVTFDAYPGVTALAEVNELAAEGHPVTGTFQADLRIVDFPYTLKRGLFAKAVLLPSRQAPYFKVPIHAMVEGLQDQVAIYTAKEDKAQRTVVVPEYIGEAFFTVDISQLEETTALITEGAAYLRDGESFKTLD